MTDIPTATGALLNEKTTRRGVHRSTRELEDSIRAYRDCYHTVIQNPSSGPTADQTLESGARFCNEFHTDDAMPFVM